MPRKRSSRALSLAEREEISRGLSAGKSFGNIVAALERSTSPEQIASWLKRESKADSPRVSHETIYRSLFIQARGTLRRGLCEHLHTRRKKRQPNSRTDTGRSGSIVGGISIRERPAEAEDRAVPEHWEGDLICGPLNSYITTLVERHSRFVMLVKVESKETAVVTRALKEAMVKLPEKMMKTLTRDRGSEMADHEWFSVETDVDVYFCDPVSPSLAAREQREHQRPAQAVFSEVNGTVDPQSGATGRGGVQVEHAPAEDIELVKTCRYTQSDLCIDRLSPRSVHDSIVIYWLVAL